MSAGTGTAQAAPVPAPAGTSGASQPSDRAGRALRLVTVVPTLLAAAWLLAGLPLLLAGRFTPWLMLGVSLPVAAVLVTLGVRWAARRSPGPLALRGAAAAATPWWSVAVLVAIALAFGIDQFAYHSQYVVISRDPASYLQFSSWIAGHGSLPVPSDAAAFGGDNPALSFNTPAFYQVGNVIVPQFMAGLPMVMSAAVWIGGINLAVATNALLGACGVLAFGGLAARLVGPRWAPLGALALALTWPQQYTGRETLSEPLAQLLFLGGLCLLIDSFDREGAARRGAAALAGLVIGLTLLVRIDGASDMLPLIPYCGMLVLTRQRQAWPLVGGLVAGSAYGAVDGLVLSRPYLAAIRGSLIPLTALGAVAVVATAAVVLLRWQRGLPSLKGRWLPAAAAIPVLFLALFLARPYLQVTRGPAPPGQLLSMAQWQAAEHLAIDPHRMYEEISLHWVFWYAGIPVVIGATIGAAVLAWRCLRGGAPLWTLPLLTFGWIIVATLARPAIVPDQPWASRRLVPGVLPGFILLALWAAALAVAWLRRRGARPLLAGAVVVVVAVLMLGPAVKTTFGIQRSAGGGLTAAGMAFRPVYRGEISAVNSLCAALPADASVLFVGGPAGNQFSPAVRGQCGLPAAVVKNPRRPEVASLVAAVRRAGRRPVLLASTSAFVSRFGDQPRHVVGLRTQGDAHTLVAPPVMTSPQTIDVWMSESPH